jgi:hypothetical protein
MRLRLCEYLLGRLLGRLRRVRLYVRMHCRLSIRKLLTVRTVVVFNSSFQTSLNPVVVKKRGL